jgi:cytochrome c biogenesis protein CcmG, thiol:disulfide interchange protein DsbE
MNSRTAKLVPVLLFFTVAIFLYFGLAGDPKRIPSVLIGKPIPEFNLAAIPGLNVPGLASADLKQGQVNLVNIWASWCVPCREEQPLLLELAKRTDLRIVGINNKDDPENARTFLGTLGNPFAAIGADPAGRTTIDFGAYGVPESFLVDGNGIIRFKIIGGITPQMLNNELPIQIAKAAKPLP